MRGLSFICDNELFAVDVSLVQKVILNMDFTPVPAPPGVAGLANIKGGIVTVFCLNELLGRKKSKKAVNAVVFKSFSGGNDQIGLLVDQSGDLIEITEDKIHPPPVSEAESDKFCISGIAEADGKFYRIINPEGIIKSFENLGESANNTNITLEGGNND